MAAFRSFDFERTTDEGYFRNVSCALSKISTFYFYKL